MIGWDDRYRPLVEGEFIISGDECRQDDGSWKPALCVGGTAPNPAYSSHRKYRRLLPVDAVPLKRAYRAGRIIGALFGSPDVPKAATDGARKMVSGDLWHHSEHRFPEDCWAGGRTDCRRCGAFLNSFYDDEHGCRGPTWMRAFDGWDGGREE